MNRPWTSVVMLTALTVTAGAETHIARPDGCGDFPTIRAAIDAALDGDTIVLSNGVSSGDGNRALRIVYKDLILRSESGDPQLCILDCEGTELNQKFGFYLEGQSEATLLRGVTITRGYRRFGGAIYLESAYPTIEDCIFHHNQAVGGGAIDCDWAASPTVIRCSFWANSADWGGAMCI